MHILPAQDTLKSDTAHILGGVDSRFIESFYDYHNITIPLSYKYAKLELNDKLVNRKLTYFPNQDMTIGVSVNYRWIGVSLSTAAPLINNDIHQKGKTTAYDFSTNFYLKKSTIDVGLLRYKGFYLENHASFTDAYAKIKVYPRRPDMQVTLAGFNYYYVLNNKRFSYPGVFAYTAMQKRNTGSFLFGGFASYFNTTADSAFVFGTFRQHFSKNAGLKLVETYMIGGSVGYIYTFVMKKRWFTTFSMNPGTALMYYYSEYQDPYTDTLGQQHRVYDDALLAWKLQFRLATGYNSHDWYGGFVFMFDSFAQPTKTDAYLNYEYGNARFYLGRRFDLWKRKKNEES